MREKAKEARERGRNEGKPKDKQFHPTGIFCKIALLKPSRDLLMTDWSYPIALIGRFLLAFYFLKAGINNAYHADKLLGLIKAKNIPLPRLVAYLVITTEIVASLAIIFNVYTLFAALALIIFTLTVNFLICNYWNMEGIQKRNVSFVFYANIAVIGALLLVTTTHV